MFKKVISILSVLVFVSGTSLLAQQAAGSAPTEAAGTSKTKKATNVSGSLKELQATETIQDEGIEQTTENFKEFASLVEKARIDRETKWKERNVDPNNFENTFRKIQFAPRNSYVRYVEDLEKDVTIEGKTVKGNILLEGFGEVADVTKEIQNAVKISTSQGNSSAKTIAFNQGRVGIEIMQYDFIKERTKENESVAVGSQRKSVALLYKKSGDNLTLDMVVTRIVNDHLREGTKEIQLIIDPTPLDPGLDDLIIIDRYNQKPAKATILGTVLNSANSPYRLKFKQSFYQQHLANFYRMYRLVLGFSSEDDSEYQHGVITDLKRSLQY